MQKPSENHTNANLTGGNFSAIPLALLYGCIISNLFFKIKRKEEIIMNLIKNYD